MGKYKYIQAEKDFNKVLKMNQDKSFSVDDEYSSQIAKLDSSISSSEDLLKSLGNKLPQKKSVSTKTKLSEEIKEIPSYQCLVQKANQEINYDVELEDLLNEKEFQEAYSRLDSINKEFSKKTSIINKTDLAFLGIATALQTAKALLFGLFAEKLNYGKSFDSEKRLPHNDKSIEDAHKNANEKFIDRHKKHAHGYWMEILYQPPAFDITRGAPAIGRNMEGGYHRIHTLGHDPILGWIFGTANILTDTITFEDFQTNIVKRKPKPMIITPIQVSLSELFSESYEMTKADYLNLPAAIFAEAQHLKSDEFTKLGLPVPVLETINPDFASKLYKQNYDALCFSRDLKIVGGSLGISVLIDLIIGLVHRLFNKEKTDKNLYEVRTRKILLISNSIASSSNIIQSAILKNPKNLDIGGLMNTVSHLFRDLRFISRIKEEFINQELNKDLLEELKKLDNM